MELLKGLPGISVQKHEVQPSPTGRYSNVTELNVLYPFSRKSPSNICQQMPSSRLGHRVHSTNLQMRPDSIVRGTAVTTPTSDPRSILKRPKNHGNHENSSSRIFLQYNAAQARHWSSQSDTTSKRTSRKQDFNRSSQEIPKGPTKNVTFNLDDAHDVKSKTASQWSVGISRISRPVLLKRRVTFKDQRSKNSKKDNNVSQRERRIFYLPLLLKGRSNGRKGMKPSTAEPSQRMRRNGEVIHQLEENGKTRLRTMAGEYRRGLQIGSLSKSSVDSH